VLQSHFPVRAFQHANLTIIAEISQTNQFVIFALFCVKAANSTTNGVFLALKAWRRNDDAVLRNIALRIFAFKL
jgi:hypothetical protein